LLAEQAVFLLRLLALYMIICNVAGCSLLKIIARQRDKKEKKKKETKKKKKNKKRKKKRKKTPRFDQTSLFSSAKIKLLLLGTLFTLLKPVKWTGRLNVVA
jgi:hypothetical protein